MNDPLRDLEQRADRLARIGGVIDYIDDTLTSPLLTTGVDTVPIPRHCLDRIRHLACQPVDEEVAS